jgi:hypothetical protein
MRDGLNSRPARLTGPNGPAASSGATTRPETAYERP